MIVGPGQHPAGHAEQRPAGARRLGRRRATRSRTCRRWAACSPRSSATTRCSSCSRRPACSPPPAANAAVLTGQEFFPQLISGPFHHGLVIVFSLAPDRAGHRGAAGAAARRPGTGHGARRRRDRKGGRPIRAGRGNHPGLRRLSHASARGAGGLRRGSGGRSARGCRRA